MVISGASWRRAMPHGNGRLCKAISSIRRRAEAKKRIRRGFISCTGECFWINNISESWQVAKTVMESKDGPSIKENNLSLGFEGPKAFIPLRGPNRKSASAEGSCRAQTTLDAFCWIKHYTAAIGSVLSPKHGPDLLWAQDKMCGMLRPVISSLALSLLPELSLRMSGKSIPLKFAFGVF